MSSSSSSISSFFIIIITVTIVVVVILKSPSHLITCHDLMSAGYEVTKISSSSSSSTRRCKRAISTSKGERQTNQQSVSFKSSSRLEGSEEGPRSEHRSQINSNNKRYETTDQIFKSNYFLPQSIFHGAKKRRYRRYKAVSSRLKSENVISPGIIELVMHSNITNNNKNINTNNNNNKNTNSNNSNEVPSNNVVNTHQPLSLPQTQPAQKTKQNQRQKQHQQQSKKHQHHLQQQQQILLRYKINENEPAGSRLASLIEDAQLREEYNSQLLNGTLSFAFLSESIEFFEIESATGIIRTTAVIDRENTALCRGAKDACEVSLDVVVQPTRYFRIIKVKVEIYDVNDNSPKFPESIHRLQVIESSSVGTRYRIPPATDLDGPNFSIKRYELESLPISSSSSSSTSSLSSSSSSSPYFTLDTVQNLERTLDLYLVLRRPLDREQHAHHRLKVKAFDGGIPYREGSMDVVVVVQDVNDNRPAFSKSRYEVRVKENEKIDSKIIKVIATDPDEGDNGKMTYILAHQPILVGLFYIQPITGEIELKGTLDREELGNVLELMVEARDHGKTPLTCSAVVVVHIEDVNDNAPMISITTLSHGPSASSSSSSSSFSSSSSSDHVFVMAELSEDSPLKTFVALVKVTDPDLGINGNVTCQMTCEYKPTDSTKNSMGELAVDNSRAKVQHETQEDMTFSFTKTFDSEYTITTQKSLDREIVEHYRLIVRCQDSALKTSDRKTSEKILDVVIRDVNDNQPLFSNSKFEASIVENNFIGTSVIQITATDEDVGENGRVRYIIFPLIDDDDSSNLNLPNSTQGLPQPPKHPQTTTKSAQRFQQPRHHLTSFFHIDQRGVITAHAVLDREKFEAFVLKILAVDGGHPTLTGSAIVVINVVDVNDEKPRFLQPTYSFSVAENEPVGSKVGYVTASDKDGPKFNAFFYGFENDLEMDLKYAGGSDNLISNDPIIDLNRSYVHRKSIEINRYFSIDSMTGCLAILRPLDRETIPVHRLSVIAYDPKTPQMSGLADVSINVIDVNDNPPLFIFPTAVNKSVKVYLETSPTLPHFVAKIMARDDDKEENARISYELLWLTRQASDVSKDEDEPLMVKTQLSSNESSSQQNETRTGLTNDIELFSLFKLDSKSGNLYLLSDPTEISISKSFSEMFILTLLARDHGTPSLSTTSELFLATDTLDFRLTLASSDSFFLSSVGFLNLNKSLHALIILVLLVSSLFVCILLLISAVCVVQKRKRLTSLTTVSTINCDGRDCTKDTFRDNFDDDAESKQLQQLEQNQSKIVNSFNHVVHSSPQTILSAAQSMLQPSNRGSSLTSSSCLQNHRPSTSCYNNNTIKSNSSKLHSNQATASSSSTYPSPLSTSSLLSSPSSPSSSYPLSICWQHVNKGIMSPRLDDPLKTILSPSMRSSEVRSVEITNSSQSDVNTSHSNTTTPEEFISTSGSFNILNNDKSGSQNHSLPLSNQCKERILPPPPPPPRGSYWSINSVIKNNFTLPTSKLPVFPRKMSSDDSVKQAKLEISKEIPLTTLVPIKIIHERTSKKTSILSNSAPMTSKEQARVINPSHLPKGRLNLKSPLSLIRENIDEASNIRRLSHYNTLIIQSHSASLTNRQPISQAAGSNPRAGQEGPNVISGIDPDSELLAVSFHASRIERV